jgi:hypothetical protein
MRGLENMNARYLSGGFPGVVKHYGGGLLDSFGAMSDADKKALVYDATLGFDPDSVEGMSAWDMGLLGIMGAIGGGKVRSGKKLLNAGNKVKKKDVPSLRGLPVDDAVKIARKEPHLNASHDTSEGKYIGGPRNIKTKQQLNKMRDNFDAFVARDPRGGDWYDRYRADVDLVTGKDPVSNEFMAAQEGQWSAGVSPQAELGFAIKENNGTLTGFPVKAGRPLPHQRHNEAAQQNDVSRYLRGEKTGEYADHIIPGSKLAGTATGVNDFRHAINLGYTEPSGVPQRQGLNKAQHAFSDYETALAVDRANKANLGGRSDWTGEQLQAAPWVMQKADDLFGKGNTYRKRAKQQLVYERSNDMSPEKIESVAREMAFQDANKQIGDFYPKHTAHATYEKMPGPTTGNLPGMENATAAERAQIGADPRGSFATAPGGRDAIYSGLRYGDSGVAARVMPTVQSQGVYQPPGGQLEFNPGEVARPLVGLETLPSGQKVLPAGDRAMLDAGETLRAAIGGQDAGAAHITTTGGRTGDQRSIRVPMDRKLSEQELVSMSNVGKKYGLLDMVDTGTGVTATDFKNPLGELEGGLLTQFGKDAQAVLPDAEKARRVNVDGIYADLTDAWKAGEGSGEVSKQLLGKINITPEMRSAFDRNPDIAKVAMNYIERDKDLAKQFGTKARKDLQELRSIIGTGPGWVAKVEDAIKKGIVPGVAAAFLTKAYSLGPSEQQSDPRVQ